MRASAAVAHTPPWPLPGWPPLCPAVSAGSGPLSKLPAALSKVSDLERGVTRALHATASPAELVATLQGLLWVGGGRGRGAYACMHIRYHYITCNASLQERPAAHTQPVRIITTTPTFLPAY